MCMRIRIATMLMTVALVLTMVLAGRAYAEDATAGLLKCDVASGWGFIFGSSKDLKCVYSPVGGQPTENYTGEIQKFGVDIGYTQSGVILWSVLAPRTNLEPGALEGKYVGVTAEASAGAGIGANVLVGGGNSVSLQPISISGQEGLNVAAGIGALNLKASK
jgi:Protein of unknown function (DUF992)